MASTMATVATALTLILIVENGEAAIAFYQAAFGAEEAMRIMDPARNVVHAELHIGGAMFYVGSEFPEGNLLAPRARGGTPVTINLTVPNVDAVAARAVAAGATLAQGATDQFYGIRDCRLVDPFGHVWLVGTPIEHVSPEEMQRRADAMYGAA